MARPIATFEIVSSGIGRAANMEWLSADGYANLYIGEGPNTEEAYNDAVEQAANYDGWNTDSLPGFWELDLENETAPSVEDEDEQESAVVLLYVK